MFRPVLAPDDSQRRPWRVLGCLAIGQVVLTFGGAAIDHGSAEIGASHKDVVRHFVTYSMTGKFGGQYVEFVGSLVLLAAALLLARLLRDTGDVSAWLTSAISATAALYAAMISTASAAQAAAVYGGHHGTSLTTVSALNDVGDIAFYLSIGVLGTLIACAGAAGLASRRLPRWLAYSGLGIGVVGVLAPIGAAANLQQGAFLLQTAWWLALGVIALRPRPTLIASARPREISVA